MNTGERFSVLNGLPLAAAYANRWFRSPLFTLTAALLLCISMARAATSVKVYGALAQADLSGIAAVTPSFSPQFCTIASGASPVCGGAALTWTHIADANADGIVDNPGDGTMNAQGWMLADQYIQISNVKTNDPGWLIDIFTDNLDYQHSYASPLYQGPLIGPLGPTAPINGLVSSSKDFLIPLAWKVTTSPVTNFTDTNQWPNWDEDADLTGCRSSVGSAGFCDFSTHYMADLLDVDPKQPIGSQWTWWQYISEPDKKHTASQYQSPLSSEGVATGDSLRSPLPTYNGTYQVYISAHFAPGTIRDHYQTTIYMEITHL